MAARRPPTHKRDRRTPAPMLVATSPVVIPRMDRVDGKLRLMFPEPISWDDSPDYPPFATLAGAIAANYTIPQANTLEIWFAEDVDDYDLVAIAPNHPSLRTISGGACAPIAIKWEGRSQPFRLCTCLAAYWSPGLYMVRFVFDTEIDPATTESEFTQILANGSPCTSAVAQGPFTIEASWSAPFAVEPVLTIADPPDPMPTVPDSALLLILPAPTQLAATLLSATQALACTAVKRLAGVRAQVYFDTPISFDDGIDAIADIVTASRTRAGVPLAATTVLIETSTVVEGLRTFSNLLVDFDDGGATPDVVDEGDIVIMEFADAGTWHRKPNAVNVVCHV